jgi:2',3'-cyclic-nucleotide 2'-phosphodiesterase (5'-nucleotidase family)
MNMFKLIIRVICSLAFVMPLLAADLSFTILHTNDIHQELDTLSRIAGYASEYRKQNPDTVFVDAGDYFDRGSSLVPLSQGEAIYGAMATMGYDMWIFGNHDWAYGGARMFELMDKYPVPVLGTNLATTKLSLPSNLKRTIIKELDGVRVGFFGITLDTYGKNPKHRPFLYILDCRKETARAIEELKKAKVDVIVAITHLGLKKMKHETRNTHPSDINLAEEYPDIDVIIGGHSHTQMKKTQTEKLYKETGTIIVQTGGLGRKLGQLKLIIDSESRAIKRFEIESIEMTADLPEYPQTALFLKEQYAMHMPNAKVAVGQIEKPIELYNMAAWYAGFIQDKSDADIVLLPRKTLYDEHSSFKAGPLTIEKLFGILYNRYLIKSTVTGAELLKFCNQKDRRDRFNPFHHRGRPFTGDAIYYCGFKARFDSSSKSVLFSFDPAKKYTLVTPWPFTRGDLSRYRHVLPQRSVVDFAHPIPKMVVSNAQLLEQTTGQLLVAEGGRNSLTFHRKYQEPLPDWKPWTDYFEGKQ